MVTETGVAAAPRMVHCATCGTEIAAIAPACPKCGAPNAVAPTSNKSMVAAALLCFFLGTLGIHRFYVGKILTGILMIVTLGGLGIWTLIDLVMIIVGSFKDKNGLPLKR
ncbi:TM2 domain-containing protein [Roseibium suaedae]|uniref:TM2 domain-containing protein n=1 Tax=Roseibium suaedae TaxID=735517 RepID=A0A1M7LBR8_9HYPH|nr:TM2 domain-containing protein [Roseibium suaedae]SHM75300.1 TM2 domain-containing protein [Roseibium suaedae]